MINLIGKSYLIKSCLFVRFCSTYIQPRKNIYIYIFNFFFTITLHTIISAYLFLKSLLNYFINIELRNQENS